MKIEKAIFEQLLCSSSGEVMGGIRKEGRKREAKGGRRGRGKMLGEERPKEGGGS